MAIKSILHIAILHIILYLFFILKINKLAHYLRIFVSVVPSIGYFPILRSLLIQFIFFFIACTPIVTTTMKIALLTRKIFVIH